MILLAGYGSDPCVARTARAAADLGVEHILLDQEQPFGWDLTLEERGAVLDGRLSTPGVRLPLSDIDGVYARPLSPVDTGEPGAVERGERLCHDLVTWLDLADAVVVSRPGDMHSNSSKPFQAALIGAAGFDVPRSLITTDPEAVRAFAEEVGPLVFKSTSGVRSIVRRLDAGRLDRLDRVRALPTQFQELVEGVDVRVHVVGTEVFSTRIASDATDYRYAGRDGLDADLEPTTLPDDVAERCISLAAALSLPLVGIDLRMTPEGRVVCFEANPMPGYSFFEAHTGQPISTALVRLLAGKADPPAPPSRRSSHGQSR